MVLVKIMCGKDRILAVMQASPCTASSAGVPVVGAAVCIVAVCIEMQFAYSQGCCWFVPVHSLASSCPFMLSQFLTHAVFHLFEAWFAGQGRIKAAHVLISIKLPHQSDVLLPTESHQAAFEKLLVLHAAIYALHCFAPNPVQLSLIICWVAQVCIYDASNKPAKTHHLVLV